MDSSFWKFSFESVIKTYLFGASNSAAVHICMGARSLIFSRTTETSKGVTADAELPQSFLMWLKHQQFADRLKIRGIPGGAITLLYFTPLTSISPIRPLIDILINLSLSPKTQSEPARGEIGLPSPTIWLMTSETKPSSRRLSCRFLYRKLFDSQANRK